MIRVVVCRRRRKGFLPFPSSKSMELKTASGLGLQKRKNWVKKDPEFLPAGRRGMSVY